MTGVIALVIQQSLDKPPYRSWPGWLELGWVECAICCIKKKWIGTIGQNRAQTGAENRLNAFVQNIGSSGLVAEADYG